MSGFLQCLSHTPLVGFLDPAESVLEEIASYRENARRKIKDFDPQLVVLFAPDHFKRLLPRCDAALLCRRGSTCHRRFQHRKRANTHGVGPGNEAGRIRMENSVDIATSQRMQVDHGFAQPLDFLLGGIDRYPVIPIFMNCVAPPLPTFKRTRILGEIVGNFCKTLNKRVLFIASGGLSHQPPIPEYATATDDVRLVLLGAGKNLSPEAREARTNRTIEAAKKFVQDPTTLHILAPEWDQSFIDTISKGDISVLDNVMNKSVTEIAGASTHEVKTWVAAASAMSMISPYETISQYYRPIPEWIAGYGGFTARSVSGRGRHEADIQATAITSAPIPNGTISIPVK